MHEQGLLPWARAVITSRVYRGLERLTWSHMGMSPKTGMGWSTRQSHWNG